MADEKVRKSAGPMTTWICKVDETTANIVVLKTFEKTPSAKQVKEAMKELGEGKYKILTGRMHDASFVKVVAEKFDL